ncbi:MAG: histidine kinase, partial [Ignavibacteriaceae bacterium]|nr:histidine kinase [Ignavibacteriaceae bacterium]
ACDSASRSEIVLPVVLQDGSLYGVLDLDSTEYNSFDDTDAEYLSKLVEILTKKVIKL